MERVRSRHHPRTSCQHDFVCVCSGSGAKLALPGGSLPHRGMWSLISSTLWSGAERVRGSHFLSWRLLRLTHRSTTPPRAGLGDTTRTHRDRPGTPCAGLTLTVAVFRSDVRDCAPQQTVLPALSPTRSPSLASRLWGIGFPPLSLSSLCGP